MDAFALAMRAKINDVPAQDVETLVTRAEAALATDDPLFCAITAFAVQYELHRRDRDVLYQLGAMLHESVRLHCMPTPIDAARADIYG